MSESAVESVKNESLSNNESPVTNEENKMSPQNRRSPAVYIQQHPMAVWALAAIVPSLAILWYVNQKDTKKDAHVEEAQKPHAAVAAAVAPPMTPAMYYHPQPQPQFAAPAPTPVPLPTQSPPVAGYLNAGTIPPAPIQQVQSQFVVASVGKNSRGWVFLNDTPDYKVAQRTIVIKNPQVLGQYAQNIDYFKGRVVTASGTQSFFQGKPQVEAASLSVQ